MLISKSDLAKYPFTVEATNYVKNLDLKISDMASSEYIQIVDRAEHRIEEAIINGIIEWKKELEYDVEILSYPLSIIFVTAMEDAFLKRRYALAEAKRAYNLLKSEINKEKLVDIAITTFNWKIKRVSIIVDQTYDFTLNFADYLQNATAFHADKWKLVNRLVVNGTVFLKNEETARLLAEEARKHVYKKLETTQKVTLPDTFTKRIERIKQLLAKRKGEIRIVELPKGGVNAAYPPCIKYLYNILASGQNVPHIGRFTFTAFLLRIGMSVENVVKIFTSISDYNEKMTRYQVEHIAGKRGSRIQYTPPNCDTLRTHGLCQEMDDLCKKIRHPLTYYKRKLMIVKKEKSEKNE